MSFLAKVFWNVKSWRVNCALSTACNRRNLRLPLSGICADSLDDYPISVVCGTFACIKNFFLDIVYSNNSICFMLCS